MMLERSVYSQESFKKMSRYYVFCKINIDEQRHVAAAHKVTAIPTLQIYAPSGAQVRREVGGKDLKGMLSMLDQARGQAGVN